jgi:hypothetical protein
MQITEATVQAELYSRLRAEGFRVVCEANLDAPEGSSRKLRIRPDVTVLDIDDEPTVFVEVKNYSHRKYRMGPYRKPSRCPTKQLRNYVLTGVPVLLCRGWDDLDAVRQKVSILHATARETPSVKLE